MKCISTLVITFILATAGVAYAGVNVWTTHGPDGRDIWAVAAIAIDPRTPSTLYAGTRGGVYDIRLARGGR